MGLFPQMDRIAAAAVFNFPAGTPTIIASRNVSSIADNGVGDVTLNFASALPNGNYYVSGLCQAPVGGWAFCQEDAAGPITTTQLHLIFTNPLTSGNVDPGRANIVIFNSP